MGAGRPRAFNSVEHMQGAIDEYLNACKTLKRPLSISGLAADLGVSRETVFSYQRGTYGAEFSDPIKRVVQKIEAQTAEGLLSGSVSTAGAIFTLKNNHGWKDQKENSIKAAIVAGSPHEYTDAQLLAIIAGDIDDEDAH